MYTSNSLKIKEKKRLFYEEGKIKCTNCNTVKPKEYFYKDKRNKLGFSNSCKVCEKKWDKYTKKEYKIRNEELLQQGKKICSRCSVEKDLDGFYKNDKIKCGYNSHCKECDVKKNDKYKSNEQKERKKFLDHRNELLQQGKCICSKCGEIKTKDYFRKNDITYCIVCRSTIYKENKLKVDPNYYIRIEENRIKRENKNKEKNLKILEKNKLLKEGKKRCLKCQTILPIDNFKTLKKHHCISCNKEQENKQKEYNKKKKYFKKYRVCTRCNENVSKDKFLNYKRVPSYNVRICKDCYDKMSSIVCNKCKIDKPFSSYGNNKTTYLGKNTICKSCQNIRKNKNRRERRKNDPLYKLSKNIKNAIKMCFRRGGYTKKSRSYEILGCSFEDFKKHIESQFEDWMNWDNYGLYNGEECYGWDYDHIIPVSSCECEEDVYKLNHYSNFQPLCSYLNRDVKKDNLDWEL